MKTLDINIWKSRFAERLARQIQAYTDCSDDTCNAIVNAVYSYPNFDPRGEACPDYDMAMDIVRDRQ